MCEEKICLTNIKKKKLNFAEHGVRFYWSKGQNFIIKNQMLFETHRW